MENNKENEPIKLYEKNPNLKFKKYLLTLKDYSNGFSDRFEVFTYSKDNNQYIISPGVNTYLIYIIKITDSKLFKSLKGHNECISVLNYYQNKNNKIEEFILSVDIKGILIIWDVHDEFKFKFKINTNEYVIYSSIILFNIINGENYIITSNSYVSEHENSAYSKLYSLKTGKFVKNINHTNTNGTYYITYWYNQSKNCYYEIECCLEKISIIDLSKNELYHEFISENEEEAFTQAFVFQKNNKNYLCSSSMHGEIKFWDLDNKELEKKIWSGGYNLLSMIQWSDNYIIFGDNNSNKSFKILDIEQMKIISSIGGKHKKPIICIKIIQHNEYGKCLLTSGTDKTVIIWN